MPPERLSALASGERSAAMKRGWRNATSTSSGKLMRPSPSGVGS
jgi:hypothetical protein